MSAEFAVERCPPDGGYLRRRVPPRICQAIASARRYGEALAHGVLQTGDIWLAETLGADWAAYLSRTTGMDAEGARAAILGAMNATLREAEWRRPGAAAAVRRAVAPLFERNAQTAEIEQAAFATAGWLLAAAEVEAILAEECRRWQRQNRHGRLQRFG